MNSNVNSTARILKKDITADEYTLGTFNSNTPAEVQNEKMQNVATLNTQVVTQNNDSLLGEFQKLSNQISQMQNQINSIEAGGAAGRDLDQQIIQALKDLKNTASFFQNATFQLESKILKTSMSIAKKIIGVEIGEQSHQIARVTIENILNKIKTATQVTIHLNPKDYTMLKDDLVVESFVKIEEDPNVAPGGVVIASDLGNFDGNIEAKIDSILESLDTVI
jgi:flagellar assembly protein FliH